ncbi:MAG TPA: AAA family ATPase [Ktedonobacterales bacterium]|nr:AAA family ATPase [Ktedonobacterales bacterium]
MAVDLLERDPFLRTLDDLLSHAAAGHGRIVLVSGEAGIGKTSVVERFIERNPSGAHVLWGTCEALFTPRPLGPLHDIARQGRPALRAMLENGENRATLFAAVLDELAYDPPPTVLVIEDIHWADEATLDLVKFLARRIHRMPALLILTYRDDEIDRDHPLRLVLGDLPARDVVRLQLPPLSEAVVTALAEQAGRSTEHLYATTGGNPFYVTEVLASHAPGIPVTIRDAVLTQVARLSPSAREVLTLASVAPSQIEQWVIETAFGASSAPALEECLAAGMLSQDRSALTLRFRHELARQAVEGSISPARARTLHADVLRALLAHEGGQIEVARLVHHAALAQDAEQTLRFAPRAAKQAAAQGAHREAVEQYRTALRFADGLAADARAELLEDLAHEHLLTGRMPEAIQAGEDALAIWRKLDIPLRIGHNLRWFSRVYWYAGQKSEARDYVESAARLLQMLPPGSELAWAYSYRAMFAMLAEEAEDAQEWANRAIELAEQLGDDKVLLHAYNTLGMAQLNAGDQQGQALLERSLRLALERGYEEHAGRAYANLSSYFVRFRDYANAHHYVELGITHCSDNDLDLYKHQLIAWRALASLEQGNWLSASEDANEVVRAYRGSPVNTIHARAVLGWVRMRCGDPGMDAPLDEARNLALSTGELQRIAPVMAARAEAAWLRGDLAQCAAEARIGFEVACARHNPWQLGQLAFWLWRAGALPQTPPGAAAPYALQMAGEWRAAADAWEAIGCPYEQALALMDGDEAAQRQALSLFERLGARPAAEMLRRQLRTAGARGLPRGPRPATQANPYGLTNRQFEILLLLAEGLRNPEIADRLSTTPKTIEHHVSDVLAKLNVRSRAEAVRLAYQLGLVPQPTKPPTGKMGV